MIKKAEKKGSGTHSELESLRVQNAQLERRLERKESELADARLELDTFAHSISHDLRSPLNIISGFADLLKKHSEQGLDEKGQRYLWRITTATDQIGLMIDGILALSRMSRSEMRRGPVALEPLVRRVVRGLEPEKGDRRVIWLIGSLPTVNADPTLIREAIASLASNALRFTRSREVARIQIGMQDGNGETKFFVRDNGASFDIKHRERLFDVAQGQNRPTAPNSGAIRLAYVHRIFQRHGGRMWTEALPDGGATFYFTLPIDGAATDPAPNPQ